MNMDILGAYSLNSAYLWVTVWIVFLLFFVGISIFLTWIFFSFNVKVITFEKVGERGQRSKEQSGKHIVKDGSEFLKVSGYKELLPFPSSQFVTNNKGFRFKTLLNYYKTSEAPEDWKPISCEMVKEDNAVKFEAHDAEVRLWSSTRQREKVNKYDDRTWWDKYGSYVGLGAVCVLLIFTVLMITDTLKSTTESITSTQQTVSADVKQIQQMQERMSNKNQMQELSGETIKEVPAGG